MQQVDYTFLNDDGDFDVEALVNGARIGQALGWRTGDRVQLNQIEVNTEGPLRAPNLPTFIRLWLGRPKLRRRGIGDGLLKRFLAEADTAGIHEVWGSVMPKDLKDAPFPLRWYAKNGFSIEEPDGESMEGAVKNCSAAL